MQNSTELFTDGYSNTSKIVRSSNSTTEDYDHVGAMQFIIATILVYSIIGVCCTLVVRIKRSHTNKSQSLHVQDEHIQKYIKQKKYLRQDGFKMKLAFECDRTRERLDEVAGKRRLLDIQEAVQKTDFAEVPKKENKRRRKRGRKIRLDSLVGKMGFTLLLVPEMEKAKEFELKQNGHTTSSAASSISGTPSLSVNSITEIPVLHSRSTFMPEEKFHETNEDLPLSYASCTSSDDSLQNTLTRMDDIRYPTDL